MGTNSAGRGGVGTGQTKSPGWSVWLEFLGPHVEAVVPPDEETTGSPRKQLSRLLGVSSDEEEPHMWRCPAQGLAQCRPAEAGCPVFHTAPGGPW